MDPATPQPPERLWHYTNGVGAEGIITSGTLRAGHLGYMNDSSEVSHAVTLSQEMVPELEDKFPQHTAALRMWAEHGAAAHAHGEQDIFAISFTENPDLLSQWRGYASGPGGPFCLGIFSAGILEESRRAGWRLIRCEYDLGRQQAIVRDAIVSAFEDADQNGVLDSSGYGALRILFEQTHALAASVKHPSFAEEAEWRLVWGPTNLLERPTRSPLGFSARRNTLAPYLEFNLTSDGAPLDDLHWYAGPGPEQVRANRAMEFVAKQAGVMTFCGTPSRTPFLP